MSKHTFLCILSIAVIISACHPKINSATATPENLNRIIRDAKGNPDLYGRSTEEGLHQPPFNSWYLPEYNNYTADSNIITTLRPQLRGKTIDIFMATWCGDSRREVPRMLKILHQCGFPPSSINIINVGGGDQDYKQSPTHEERGKNIHRVPTFIVYRQGKELNRIVEIPVQSQEKDLLRILQGEPYIPQYAGAAHLLQWYSHPNWQANEKDSITLAAGLKKIVRHRGELDGLGRVQLSLQEINKALFTLQLNTILFPEQPAVLRSYSKALLRKGDTSSANHYLEKAARYLRQ